MRYSDGSGTVIDRDGKATKRKEVRWEEHIEEWLKENKNNPRWVEKRQRIEKMN